MGKLITLVARFAKHRTPGGSPTSQVPRSGPSQIRRGSGRVVHQFEIAVDGLDFGRAGARQQRLGIGSSSVPGKAYDSRPAQPIHTQPAPAATNGCIGDRLSLHLQQIYSKISPRG